MAWSCNGSSVATVSDYMHNPVYQVLIGEDEYFDVRSDERLYLDLRASPGYVKEVEKLEMKDSKINLHILLKEAETKKLRLKVWVHSLGKYLYILSKNGLLWMRGKQSVKKGAWRIGGKKWQNKQRGKGFPIGLIASDAAPFLGEVESLFFVGRRRSRRQRWEIK